MHVRSFGGIVPENLYSQQAKPIIAVQSQQAWLFGTSEQYDPSIGWFHVIFAALTPSLASIASHF